MRLSYSNYKIYKECPRRYLYERVVKRPSGPRDKRAAISGLVLQKVLEDFYNHQIYLRKNVKASEWMKSEAFINHRALVASSYTPWKKGEEEGILAEYPIVCDGIIKTIKEDGLLTRDARSEIYGEREMTVSGDIINGRMDFRIPKDGEVWIVDGKNTKHGLTYLDPEQLYWYALLEKKKNGRFPDKLGWWLFQTEEVVWIDWTAKDVVRLENDIVETIKTIKLESQEVKKRMAKDTPDLFLPKPSRQNCRFCSYTDVCKPHQEMLAVNKIKISSPEMDDGFNEIDL